MVDWTSWAGGEKLTNLPLPFQVNKLLHGEQGIEIVNPLPKVGRGFVQSKYIGVYDVGKAAIFENETTLTDESGKVLAKLTGASFIRDAGGFGGLACFLSFFDHTS